MKFRLHQEVQVKENSAYRSLGYRGSGYESLGYIKKFRLQDVQIQQEVQITEVLVTTESIGYRNFSLSWYTSTGLAEHQFDMAVTCHIVQILTLLVAMNHI